MAKVRSARGGLVPWMCADLDNGKVTAAYRLPPGLAIRSLGTVTTDGRYYAGGTMTEPGWKMFDITLVDLQKGEHRILDRDPFILNPHPLVRARRRANVDHSTQPRREVLAGRPTGAVGRPGRGDAVRAVGARRPPDGIGRRHAAHYTMHGPRSLDRNHGPNAAVRIGQRRVPSRERQLAGGACRATAPRRGPRLRGFNHVGASRCGRIFSADDWQPPYKIVIGSTQAERAAVICESQTSPTRSQNTHPHPYVTPDLKWVIFNSNRTGQDHVYAARIPEERMTNLLG